MAELPFLSAHETKRLERIFSDKTGLINALLERNELRRFGIRMYQCLSANSSILWNLEREVSSGGIGINSSEIGALWACIGEALERYCMSYADKNHWTNSRWLELPARLRPRALHLHTEAQYRMFPYLTDYRHHSIAWVKTRHIFEDRELLWPASLIYLPFSQGRGKVSETTSTGVAAAPRLDEACCGGLLEVIERDALMINFHQELNAPEIDLATITGSNAVLVRTVRQAYKLKVYRLYSDINIPITLAYIWREGRNGPHFGIGAAADLSWEKAINKSIKEALFTRFYSKHLMDLRVDDCSQIKSLHQHFLYYQGKRFYQLLRSGTRIPFTPEYYSLGHLQAELRKNSLEPHYIDLTTPDVENIGIKVVKVVIPGMVDLNKTHGLRREDAARFWEVPRKLGLTTGAQLSNRPHPFP